MRSFKKTMTKAAAILLTGLAAVLCGCNRTDENAMTKTEADQALHDTKPQESNVPSAETVKPAESAGHTDKAPEGNTMINFKWNLFSADENEPYAVRTVLRELAVADPNTGSGIYGRYTELIVDENAPDTMKSVIAECNHRAEYSVRARLSQAPGAVTADVQEVADKAPKKGYSFATYAYILTVTRADKSAFSILETEYELSEWDDWNGSTLESRFTGRTYDTESGDEILLSELIADADVEGLLSSAVSAKYGSDQLAVFGPDNYAWTADALGIRFYLNSSAVSEDERRSLGDYSDDTITVSLSYDELAGPKAAELSKAPKSYIAQIELEKVYDLPYGDRCVMLTKQEDGQTVIRMMPDHGAESSLIIENTGAGCVFYIIRSKEHFYLFRERQSYKEGMFYDFERPDGGFGRFAYSTAQCFDSYLADVGLALVYDPYCVPMSEVKRSFGENSYGAASFVPHGHYEFPDDPKIRYQSFTLIDDRMQIDSGNVACRLLEDMVMTELDAAGNAIGEITVKAGNALILEGLTGQASRYLAPPMRNMNDTVYTYYCSLPDGRKLRFVSDTESVIAVDGKYLNRFTEAVSLAEAGAVTSPEAAEVFTVHIGQKDYPVIPDYSKIGHVGEKIEFGGDCWWQVEGYVGTYVMTEDDQKELAEDFYFGGLASLNGEENSKLTIREDGHVIFDYMGIRYEGDLSEKRYYGMNVTVGVKSENGEYRSFEIILRDRRHHEEPNRISFYSEGLPATNEPSKVPPLTVYLSKE